MPTSDTGTLGQARAVLTSAQSIEILRGVWVLTRYHACHPERSFSYYKHCGGIAKVDKLEVVSALGTLME